MPFKAMERRSQSQMLLFRFRLRVQDNPSTEKVNVLSSPSPHPRMVAVSKQMAHRDTKKWPTELIKPLLYSPGHPRSQSHGSMLQTDIVVDRAALAQVHFSRILGILDLGNPGAGQCLLKYRMTLQ